ncbi:MAG: methyltransferase domain-containing protein [Micropepsaceae bacterium]
MENPVDLAEDALQAGRPAEAVALLSPLAAAERLGPLGQLTLGRALLAAGETDRALDVLREVVSLNRNWADAAVAFGRALLARDALPTAIAEFQRALRADPDCGAAELALAEAWTAAGEPEKAAAHLEAAVALGEDGGALVARLDAMRGQARSDAGYVRHLFDQFSSDYDTRMRGSLAYRAPEILAELMGMVSGGKPKKAATLDLGCGTGLAAPVFRPFATKLRGIDLSPQMVAQAKTGGLYDGLVVGDIEDWMAETPMQFGRVIAADVLVYLGDLARVFAGVKRVLKPGGVFLFTVERSETEDFVLQETKRWAHGEDYLQRMAMAHGFDVRGLIACTPRVNKGVPIPGLAGAFAAP